MKYRDKPLAAYIDDLAAKSPVPGGGSAAAVSGALAAALIGMVARYTAGKKGYERCFAEIDGIIDSSDKFKRMFLELSDRDMEVYGRLRDMLKDKGAGGDALTKAYVEAAEIPLKMCWAAEQCIRLCERLLECGNKNLIADTATAAIMSASAFESAKYNVLVNLAMIEGIEFDRDTRAELAVLEKSVVKARHTVDKSSKEIMASTNK